MDEYALLELLPGIYRIPIPLTGNPLKELNCYVFRKKNEPQARNLIIDTGFKWGMCYSALLEGLRELKIDLDETDILLTHLHGDHIGNVCNLKTNHNKAYLGYVDHTYLSSRINDTDIMNSLEAGANRFRANGVSENIIEKMRVVTFSTIADRNNFVIPYTDFSEGHIFEVGDYRLKAIETPGHTPGHMCFSIEETGAMILGDHVLFDITPNITFWPGVEDSLGDYLNSLDKIDKYDVALPLPAHRHAGDFHERVHAIKKHHMRRLDECIQIISDLKHATLYDITGMVSWKIKAKDWDNFPPFQRWFALGECTAHLDYLIKRGEIKTDIDSTGMIYYKV